MTAGVFLEQLRSVIAEYNSVSSRSGHDDLSDLPGYQLQSAMARIIAAVHRISGINSTYSLEIARLIENQKYLHLHANSVAGVGKALLADLEAGYLESFAEQLHANTFADFLHMAQHLADSGFKDAAAVIAGSALEAHLRAACSKCGIDTDVQKPDGSTIDKKADTMNADLVKAGFYEKLDQKSVTAWLGLRNNAAHGKYDKYEVAQVQLLIAGVREFISRNPA